MSLFLEADQDKGVEMFLSLGLNDQKGFLVQVNLHELLESMVEIGSSI